MKIHDAKVSLDKNFFYNGENVSGKLVVKAISEKWVDEGKIFIKFYDKLNIEWIEEELSIGENKRVYSNYSRPFQVNAEKILSKENAVLVSKLDDGYVFSYAFSFQLPEHLQGTISDTRYAKNQYFIKAYLTNDEAVASHYHDGANVFDEFFKSLNHTFVKQEVTVKNRLAAIPEQQEKLSYEAKSTHYKVTVSLPKLIYRREETLQVHLNIERADPEKHTTPLSLHKISFKLYQSLKLTSKQPAERVRLFEELISHSSRKNVHQNTPTGILLEEFIQIPKTLQPSSSRSDPSKAKANPIRVNYKISLGFWKNFLNDELDINIPILVDPEA